ncbi:hypothetical protein [Streptomyces olivochromogenes]|uniref:hypothetical protein n=1 Tax=Streptomyces olivochromogenes TaxID=1963 RepID=UPI0027E3F622|nr:hypothetical protein [Streptomyces olivochromogenes]
MYPNRTICRDYPTGSQGNDNGGEPASPTFPPGARGDSTSILPRRRHEPSHKGARQPSARHSPRPGHRPQDALGTDAAVLIEPICLAAVQAVRQSVLDQSMVPLVIGPSGGVLGDGGTEPVPVQRTFAAARSVEFDALLLAGAPAPAADAHGSRDAKAAGGGAAPVDPRVLLLVGEAYRHAKAIGGWNGARQVYEALGIASDAPGVVSGDDGTAALSLVTDLLARHRVWDRFPALM